MSYCSVLHIDRCIYVLEKVLHADSQTLADALQGGKRRILHSSLYMTNIGRVNGGKAIDLYLLDNCTISGNTIEGFERPIVANSCDEQFISDTDIVTE